MINEKIQSLILEIINEALGVPENLIESSEELYDDILKKISKLKKKSFSDPDTPVQFKVKKNYRISDYDITRVNMEIYIMPHQSATGVDLYKAGIESQSKKSDITYNLIHHDTGGEILLQLRFAVPLEWEMSDVIEYFKIEKNEIIRNLSHELKHAYDHTKTPSEKSEDRASYMAFTNLRFNIPPIDSFLHDLYYIHQVENLVRPSEVASAIKTNKISQRDFLEFLMSNDTYKNLKKIQNFSVKNFKEEVGNYLDIIDRYLEHFNELDKYKTKEERVERILELLLMNLHNMAADAMKSILTSNFMEALVGFEGNKAKKFQKYLRTFDKFPNTDSFLNEQEKKFKFVSSKMIRKISKLYDLLSKDKIKNESIINWDLYHEINKTKEKNIITNQFKYEKKLVSRQDKEKNHKKNIDKDIKKNK